MISLWTRTVAISGVQPDNLPWVLSRSPPFQPIPLARLWMGTWGEGLGDIQPWSQKPQCPQGRLRHSGTLEAGRRVISQKDGGTSGRKGFPTGSTTSLSPVKFEAIDRPLLPWFSFRLLFSSPTDSSFLKSQSLLKRSSKVHLYLPGLRPSDDLHPHIEDSLFFFLLFFKVIHSFTFDCAGSSWLQELSSSCGKRGSSLLRNSGCSLQWLLFLRSTALGCLGFSRCRKQAQ